jgi:CheY-like chemotaxis protein
MRCRLRSKRRSPSRILVPNGEIALAMATRQSYDVIFLDVEMPGMDGFEICSKIRETGA